MRHLELDGSQSEQIIRLFTNVFTDSEGEAEGRLVGELVAQLSARMDAREILGFGTMQSQTLVAAIFFSRLDFSDGGAVYLLSPVAVDTDWQRKGVGQALIREGLADLKRRGVEVVVTYGDPAFYSKVGFAPLSESVLSAPMDLSMPHGWLGQSLSGEPIAVREGRPVCVEPFRDPGIW